MGERFFANANDIPLPEFKYTRWSATAGGPVVLPGMYNGRQRTFFMYGYESIPEARPRNNGTPTVPTEKMRTGDFSELLALGPQYQIYNPFTRRAIGGGRFQQDPFPGNIIPQNMINPIARAILEYVPLPRTAGNRDGTSNFQQPELAENTDYGSHTIRIDHVLTQKQRMYGRVSWYDRDSNYNNYFGNLTTGEWFGFASRQVALDHVYTLNGSTVLNLRYGFDRFIRSTNSNPANHGFDLTSLGFPGRYNDMIPADLRRFPRINVTGYQGTAVGGFHRPTETHSFVATLNKTAGAHSIRTGTEFRRYGETDRFFANNQTGQFDFNSTWTRGPLDNSPASPGELGQSFASFLLGIPSGGLVTVPAQYKEHSSTWGFFVQDDWRLGSRLTLNLGVRYEFETPLTEAENRTVRGFDFDAVQPMEAAARGALNPTATGVPLARFQVRGGLTFPGVNGEPEGLYATPKDNIMPRAGFAYQIDDHRPRAAAPAVSAVRRREHDDQRRGVLVSRAAARREPPVLGRVHHRRELHLLALRVERVSQRRGRGANPVHLGPGQPASSCGQRHLGAAVRPRAPRCHRRLAGGRPDHRRLADLGHLHVSERRADRLRQRPLHRQRRRRRAVFRRSLARSLVQRRRRLQPGLRPAARVERAHVPAPARLGADRPGQQRRSVAHQELPHRERQDAAAALRGAERLQPPAVPGPEHEPDGCRVRLDQRIDAEQLLAEGAGDGEIYFLRRRSCQFPVTSVQLFGCWFPVVRQLGK
ncbi:MAG: TonB-dependent receptor domain-containing protein [Vicinamibacterales bacterium]